MGDGFAASMSDIFDDLFGDIMGGAARPPRLGPRARRGPALQSRNHARRRLSRQDRDDQVADLGRPARPARARARKAGSKPTTCKTCAGHGRVRAQQGFFAIERTCPTCQGRGQTIDNPCDQCAGSGRVTRERTLSVNVPAGVEDGTRIRLSGEGEAGMRGGADRAISTSSCRSSRTRSSSATAPTFIAACRSRWCRRRSAANSRCARSTAATQGAHPRGRAVRPPAQTARQGHAGAAIARCRRSLHPGNRRDAAEPDAPAARTAAGVRPESSHKTHPESTGFFAKMKEFFEGARLTALPRGRLRDKPGAT